MVLKLLPGWKSYYFYEHFTGQSPTSECNPVAYLKKDHGNV